eukprot:Gb_03303 [translate_table: standard]
MYRTKEIDNTKKCSIDNYLEYLVYWCAYGPDKKDDGIVQMDDIEQDTSTSASIALMNIEKNVSGSKNLKNKCKKKFSCKKGCQCHFIIKQMHNRPLVAVILFKENQHINKEGQVVHGRFTEIASKRLLHAPHISTQMCQRIEDYFNQGLTLETVWSKYLEELILQAGHGNEISSRDLFMKKKDLENIYSRLSKPFYEKHERDAVSVDCWVKERPDDFFYYKCANESQGIPFIIGIQTLWMRKMMVKYSHGSLISMDATFSTNKYGYQLYTLMVFDKFQNGVPIAWVVSSRDTTSDIEEWLQAIFDAGVKERQDWKVCAFMTDDAAAEIQALRWIFILRIFNCNILLCLWHVRRAWLKHVRSKASKEKSHDMFKDLGNIMHACKDDHVVHQAINKFYADYADQQKFLNYFSSTWLSNNRIYMWAKAYRTMQHAN